MDGGALTTGATCAEAGWEFTPAGAAAPEPPPPHAARAETLITTRRFRMFICTPAP
jgi:putative SOS response-associated peptidase YedK